jgi:hypothetical protein
MGGRAVKKKKAAVPHKEQLIASKHFPQAAAHVGPLGKVKNSNCHACKQTGHDRFECPLAFREEANGHAMPGHLPNGEKVADYWHDNDPSNGPSAKVAKAWLEHVWTVHDLPGRDSVLGPGGADVWSAWANEAQARPLQ